VFNAFNNQTITGLSNIVAVATPRTGNGKIFALQKDGNVVAGSSGIGGFHVIEGISNATAIAVGDQQGFALKKDGTIAAWYHPEEIPAGLTNVVAIAAGTYHGLALKNDGSVVGWGPNARLAPGVPEGLSNVVAIAAGNDFSLAITTNRAVAERFMPK
jgi:alpha-tubulin suppressor-like RCC1 family protein